MVTSGPYWRDTARAVARRIVCTVRDHKPLKIIDKATVDSVSFVTGGTGAAVHVDESHVVCQRCGARKVVSVYTRYGKRRRVRWVG